jgi:sec-independent protein translocase protein TatB
VFGIGFGEMMVLAVILVVAVGPDRMPKLLKAALRGYREFRQAARDLRASTGIDELLQDEDLQALRRPLSIPPSKPTKPKAPGPAKAPGRSLEDDRAELPLRPVDRLFAERGEAAPELEDASEGLSETPSAKPSSGTPLTVEAAAD